MGFGNEGAIRPGPPVSIGLFRIMFGLLWLDMALQKAPWKNFGWLEEWIKKEINHPTFDFYKTFLEKAVLPNFTLFGYLTFFMEIALGLSLFLGLFTVLGGLGGALWQLNIALGSYSVPGEWYWTWPLLIVPHLVFAHSRAGRSLGVDRLLWDWLSKHHAGQAGIRQLVLRLM